MAKYTVSELRKLVREEAKNEKSEFKPVYGKNVQSDNEKINGKAYSDMKKQTKDYNGGIPSNKGKYNLPDDDNKGMTDLYYNNMSDEFKKRVAAQLKGYVSAQAEELHKDEKLGNAEYGSDDVVKAHKEKAEKFKNGRDQATEIGLTGRELDKKEVEKLRKPAFESKKIKKLTFKNMEFLTEGHMLSRIPDDMKTDGNRFIMKDSASNEYLVEWYSDKPEVTKRVNKVKLEEQKSKFMHLSEFNHSDVYKNSTPSSRIKEDKEFTEMLGKVRSLMK